MSSVRQYFSCEILSAAALLVAVLTALAWGYLRHEEEQDHVAVTLSRMNNILQHWDDFSGAARRQAGDAAKDGWGRSLILDDTSKMVISLGADGLPGGDGYNADVRAARTAGVSPALDQESGRDARGTLNSERR